MPKVKTKSLILSNSTSLDIVRECQDADTLMVISFSKSSSVNYPLAVTLARGARKYAVSKVGDQDIHVIVLSKTREDAGRASALLKLVGGWKSCFVSIQNRVLTHPYWIVDVLECYIHSLSRKDHRDHCLSSYRDSTGVYTVPCQKLESTFYWGVLDGESTDLPYLKKRLEKHAIRQGCEWCPHFDIQNFCVKRGR